MSISFNQPLDTLASVVRENCAGALTSDGSLLETKILSIAREAFESPTEDSAADSLGEIGRHISTLPVLARTRIETAFITAISQRQPIQESQKKRRTSADPDQEATSPRDTKKFRELSLKEKIDDFFEKTISMHKKGRLDQVDFFEKLRDFTLLSTQAKEQMSEEEYAFFFGAFLEKISGILQEISHLHKYAHHNIINFVAHIIPQTPPECREILKKLIREIFERYQHIPSKEKAALIAVLEGNSFPNQARQIALQNILSQELPIEGFVQHYLREIIEGLLEPIAALAPMEISLEETTEDKSPQDIFKKSIELSQAIFSIDAMDALWDETEAKLRSLQENDSTSQQFLTLCQLARKMQHTFLENFQKEISSASPAEKREVYNFLYTLLHRATNQIQKDALEQTFSLACKTLQGFSDGIQGLLEHLPKKTRYKFFLSFSKIPEGETYIPLLASLSERNQEVFFSLYEISMPPYVLIKFLESAQQGKTPEEFFTRFSEEKIPIDAAQLSNIIQKLYQKSGQLYYPVPISETTLATFCDIFKMATAQKALLLESSTSEATAELVKSWTSQLKKNYSLLLKMSQKIDSKELDKDFFFMEFFYTFRIRSSTTSLQASINSLQILSQIVTDPVFEDMNSALFANILIKFFDTAFDTVTEISEKMQLMGDKNPLVDALNRTIEQKFSSLQDEVSKKDSIKKEHLQALEKHFRNFTQEIVPHVSSEEEKDALIAYIPEKYSILKEFLKHNLSITNPSSKDVVLQSGYAIFSAIEKGNIPLDILEILADTFDMKDFASATYIQKILDNLEHFLKSIEGSFSLERLKKTSLFDNPVPLVSWFCSLPKEQIIRYLRSNFSDLRTFYQYCSSNTSVDLEEYFEVCQRIDRPCKITFYSKDWISFFHKHPDMAYEDIFRNEEFSVYCSAFKTPPKWLFDALLDEEKRTTLEQIISSYPLEKISPFLEKFFSLTELSEPDKKQTFSVYEFNQFFPPEKPYSSLPKEQLIRLVKFLPIEHVPVHAFYLMENAGVLFEYLETLPNLQNVPIEILLRFLQKKSQDTALLYLSEKPPQGLISRAQTLSFDQKISILRRFRQYQEQIPLQEWRALFPDISDEQIHTLVPIQALQDREDDAVFHAKIQTHADSWDLKSLISLLNDGKDCSMEDLQSVILKLLYHAKERSICGSRVVATWGNFQELDPCSTCDSLLLRIRTEKGISFLSVIGLFNEIEESFAVLELRRKLLQGVDLSQPVQELSFPALLEKDPATAFEITRLAHRLFKELREENLPPKEDVPSEEERDVQMEEPLIERAVRPEEAQMEDSAPLEGRGDQMEDLPIEGAAEASNPIQEAHEQTGAFLAQEAQTVPAAQSSAPLSIFEKLDELSDQLQFFALQSLRSREKKETLLQHLQVAYDHLRTHTALSSAFNNDEFVHRAAFLLMSILFILHEAQIDSRKGLLRVQIGERAKYSIRYLNAGKIQKLPEDNPWIPKKDFFKAAGEYPFFTVTPFTPDIQFPPERIRALITQLQKEKTLPSFCKKCASLFARLYAYEDEGFSYSLKPLVKMVAQTFGMTEDSSELLEKILLHYIGIIPKTRTAIEPNTTYYRTAQVDQFVSEKEVPRFVQGSGNFGSALCTQFLPVEPLSHDGNCAVEAMIRAFTGKTYTYEHQESLIPDIIQFRTRLVDYAKMHKEEFVQMFGSKEYVDEFISRYANPCTGGGIMWSSDIAFACAARVFNKPIYLYSDSTLSFKTDQQKKVQPVQVFSPVEAETGSPIHLLHYGGAHYAVLKEK